MLTIFNLIRQSAENYEIRPMAGMLVYVRRNDLIMATIEQDGTHATHVNANRIRKNSEGDAVCPLAGKHLSAKRNNQADKEGVKP